MSSSRPARGSAAGHSRRTKTANGSLLKTAAPILRQRLTKQQSMSFNYNTIQNSEQPMIDDDDAPSSPRSVVTKQPYRDLNDGVLKSFEFYDQSQRRIARTARAHPSSCQPLEMMTDPSRMMTSMTPATNFQPRSSAQSGSGLASICELNNNKSLASAHKSNQPNSTGCSHLRTRQQNEHSSRPMDDSGPRERNDSLVSLGADDARVGGCNRLLSTICEASRTATGHAAADRLDEHGQDRKSTNDISRADLRLIEKIMTKFSLSRDTRIPKSFLLKHRFKHFRLLRNDDLETDLSRTGVVAGDENNGNCDDNDDDDPELADKIIDRELDKLNRVERQQTLYDIGFGKTISYVKLHALGSGTYSIVYKGLSKLTQKPVALKEIRLERDEGVPFTAIREVSLLKQLRHCNIITLHDIISARGTLTLVFEYIDHDLSRYMDQFDHQIHPDNVRLFLYQLLRALQFCHSSKVLHRDLKPQNILIASNGDLKLADFGLARAKSIPTKTFTDEVVTLWYRPPDVLLGNTNYGPSIDMWGVGCIFFEMIEGYSLFTGADLKKQIECIFEIIGSPAASEFPEFSNDLKLYPYSSPRYSGRDLANMAPRLDDHGVNLLSKLLKFNPNSRIPSNDALKHEYFSEKLPRGIYAIKDSESIFSVPGVQLVDNLAPIKVETFRSKAELTSGLK